MPENRCHLLFGKTAERCVVVLQRDIPQIVHGTENAQLAEFCDPRQKSKVQERIHLFYGREELFDDTFISCLPLFIIEGAQ